MRESGEKHRRRLLALTLGVLLLPVSLMWAETGPEAASLSSAGAGGSPEADNGAWIWSISGTKIPRDKMPAEYFALSVKGGGLQLCSVNGASQGTPTVIRIRDSSVYRPPFLPETSPYRVVGRAGAGENTGGTPEAGKAQEGVSSVLVPIPELCRHVARSNLARAGRLFPDWVAANIIEEGAAILSPHGVLLGYIYDVQESDKVLGYIAVAADPSLFPVLEYSSESNPERRMRAFASTAQEKLGGYPGSSEIIYIGTARYVARYRLGDKSVLLDLSGGGVISDDQLAAYAKRFDRVRERNRIHLHQQWAEYLNVDALNSGNSRPIK